MRRFLICSALVGLAAVTLIPGFFLGETSSPQEGSTKETVREASKTASSPAIRLSPPSGISQGEAKVQKAGPAMAPRSDTIEAYLRDVEAMKEELVASSVPPQEEVLVTYDLDLTLWRTSAAAKSVFSNYAENVQLEEKYFVEFDDGALDTLEPGQRFSLPPLNGQSHSVIVKTEESLMHGAINWELVDEQGMPSGSITRIGDAVEGIFYASGEVYHLRVVNGVGWVADDDALTALIENEFEMGELPQ